ncbi:uncharacterized protein APUU_40599A [Aspergillus puulaauensis]|uniref:Cytochrome b5 heme-binding domain-containing protein n=1 Tax=Aspergillus puulaauensis TaxID=1220207 RepID=A0A7R7XMB6_9EURO|nr:uncharacterized protein APUU_40599A [Aspergillus puulaauensis]BCS24155.1 hypothetical protein APUU_40599A [Aspergillus puulaauensis]
MGWVGVATVVATTCFILYRHPPASWFPEPTAADPSRPEPASEEKEEKAAPRAARDEETVPSTTPESQPTAPNDEPTEESQTTPKAFASSIPVLDVPSFQLSDDETNNKSPATQKAQQDTTPQIAIPTLEPPSITPSTPSNVMAEPNPNPSPSAQPPVAKDASLMPPPPPPSRLQPPTLQKQHRPQPKNTLSPPAGRLAPPRPSARPSASNTLSPPPSAASSLRVPQGSRPASSMNSLSPTPVTLKPAKKASQRAVLEPGFSPLDWAALTSNPNHKLRGANLPPSLIKVTPSMLKAQNGRKGSDAWTSYQGKVYNISPYLPFHPGGKGELLRGAGKDSGKLFLEVHPWVNWDAILGECCVGILVSENEAVETENQLDAMD